MMDRLYLSYWLRGYTAFAMTRSLEAVIRRFPFSRLLPDVLLRVQAVDAAEPPLLERRFGGALDLEALLLAVREYHHSDCAYELESFWDLWQIETESAQWKLAPARVLLIGYGPEFPSELGEQVRIEFGPEAQFLPPPKLSDNLAPVRHNIRALLHLVEDLDGALTVEKRLLWSESGANFAARLAEALDDAVTPERPESGRPRRP